MVNHQTAFMTVIGLLFLSPVIIRLFHRDRKEYVDDIAAQFGRMFSFRSKPENPRRD